MSLTCLLEVEVLGDWEVDVGEVGDDGDDVSPLLVSTGIGGPIDGCHNTCDISKNCLESMPDAIIAPLIYSKKKRVSM